MAFDKDAEWGVLEGQDLPQDALTRGTRQGNVTRKFPKATNAAMGQPVPTRRTKPSTALNSMKQHQARNK